MEGALPGGRRVPDNRFDVGDIALRQSNEAPGPVPGTEGLSGQSSADVGGRAEVRPSKSLNLNAFRMEPGGPLRPARWRAI